MTKEQTITSGARQCTRPSSGPGDMLEGWAVVGRQDWVVVVFCYTFTYDGRVSVTAKGRQTYKSSHITQCPRQDPGHQLECGSLHGLSRADAKYHCDTAGAVQL
jgi:hypothetical protein